MNNLIFNTENITGIENQISELNSQSWDLRYQDSKKGLEICKEAYSLALKSGKPSLIMQSRLLKTIYSFLKRFDVEKIESEFRSTEIEIQNDDILYMFSDEYIDQIGGEKGNKFQSKNFKELLLGISNSNMATQREILDKTIEKWKLHLNKMNEPYEQTDDILVVGIRYNQGI
jgi:hypothetical protein